MRKDNLGTQESTREALLKRKKTQERDPGEKSTMLKTWKTSARRWATGRLGAALESWLKVL